MEQSVSVNKGMTVDRTVKLTLILLGMFVVVLALFSLRTEAAVYVWGPGDYNITGQESYLPGDQIYILGNVNVNSTGNLSLNSTYVQFNATGREITVKSGGSFYVTDADNNPATSADWSIITTNAGGTDWKFNASAGSNVHVRNSLLGMIGFNQPSIPEKCMKIYSTNTTFQGNTFTNNRCIFYVGSGGMLVARNNSLNSGAGYQLSNAFYVDNNGSLESSNNQISMGGASRYAYYLMFDSHTNSTYDSSTYADTVIRCVGCVANFDNLTMNLYYFYGIYANSSETRLVVNTFTDNPASGNTAFTWVKEGAQVWVNYGNIPAHFVHFLVNNATMNVKYVTINGLYVSGGPFYYWISVNNNGKFYADHLTYNNGYQNINAWILWADGGSTVSISNSVFNNHYNGFNLRSSGQSNLTLKNVTMDNPNWPYYAYSRYGIIVNGGSNLDAKDMLMSYWRYFAIYLYNATSVNIDNLTAYYCSASLPSYGTIDSVKQPFTLKNSHIYNSAGSGVFISSTSIAPPDFTEAPGMHLAGAKYEIINTEIAYSSQWGIRFDNGESLKVSGCYIHENGYTGLYSNNPQELEVSGSHFRDNGNYNWNHLYGTNIYQNGGDSPTNKFVYMDNILSANRTYNNVVIENAKGVEFSNNHLMYSLYYEFIVYNDILNVTGNTFNGTNSNSYTLIGIGNCIMNKFNDNIIGNQNYPTPTGLSLDQPANAPGNTMEISGNTFVYSSTRNIYIQNNQNTTMLFKNNIFMKASNYHIYWNQYSTAKVTLENNTFENSQYGLYLNQYYNMPMPPPGFPAQEYNWTIKNNVFRDCNYRALFIYSYSDNYDTMVIKDNKFLLVNSGMDFFVGIQSKPLIMFKGNTYQGINNNYKGVWLYNTKYITFENEAFSNLHVDIEIRNNCNNIVIRNSTFNNSQNGIDSDSGRIITIEGNEFNNINSYSILNRYCYEGVIRNNKFNNGNYGVRIYSSGTLLDPLLPLSGDLGWTIENNTFSSLTYGIFSNNVALIVRNNNFERNQFGLRDDNSPIRILNNTFASNTYGIRKYAYQMDLEVTVSGNVFTGSGDYGIYWESSGQSSSHQIMNNTFERQKTGIYLYGQYWDLSANSMPLKWNTFTRNGVGISIESLEANVTENVFTSNTVGIYIKYAGGKIANNTFDTMVETGISAYQTYGTVIEGNTFTKDPTGIKAVFANIVTSKNTFDGGNTGIVMDMSIGTLSSDTFKDCDYGLSIYNLSEVTLVDGSFKDCGYSIYSRDGTIVHWTVQGNADVTNSDAMFLGEISVLTGGKLTIKDTTFNMISTPELGYGVVVNNGGTLVLDNSYLGIPQEARGSRVVRAFYIAALDGSTVNMSSSTVSGAGISSSSDPKKMGVYLETANVTMVGVTIKNGIDGLYITGGKTITVQDGAIEDCAVDIHIQGASTLNAKGLTFDTANVEVLDTSRIIVQRKLTVVAYDDSNGPYEGVNVTIGDPAVASGLTGSDGRFVAYVDGAIISSGGKTDDLNYTVTATDGEQTFTQTAVMDANKDVAFRFAMAPTTTTKAPAISFDEDTNLIVDMDQWFVDNDALTFTSSGGLAIMVNFDGHMANFSAMSDWNGKENMTITATDTHGLSVSLEFTITVLPVNDVPVLLPIPDQNVDEDVPFELDLGEYISDPDTTLSDITVTTDDPENVTVDGTVLTLLYPDAGIIYLRISVSDGQGGMSQDVLVSIMGTDRPPYMRKELPVFNVTEDVPFLVDLTDYLWDEEMNGTASITLSSTSSWVTFDGLKATFTIPGEEAHRTVKITASDGNSGTTLDVRFNVNLVNDPPYFDNLPVLKGKEDETFVIDLSQYLHDDDTPISALSITVSGYDGAKLKVTVTGLIIQILVLEASNQGEVLVLNITATDSTSSTASVQTSAQQTLVLQGTNDGPILRDGKVAKKTATSSGADVTFEVTVTDPDSSGVDIFVVVDGKRYRMERVSGGLAAGAVYSVKVKGLSGGDHEYSFEANDNEGGADSQATTSDVKMSVAEPPNLMCWGIIILILIIVAAGAVYMFRPKRDASPEISEDIKDEEEEIKEVEHEEEEDEEEEEKEEEDEEEEEEEEEDEEDAEDEEEEEEEKEEEDEEADEEEEEEEEDEEEEKKPIVASSLKDKDQDEDAEAKDDQIEDKEEEEVEEEAEEEDVVEEKGGKSLKDKESESETDDDDLDSMLDDLLKK